MGSKRYAYSATSLETHPRLLAFLLSYNVFPRGSSYSELRGCDIFILDKMINGLGAICHINLPHIIIHQIREVAKSKRVDYYLCFPILLTRVLEHCGVDFTDATPLSPSSTELIFEHTLRYMGFDDLQVPNEEREVTVAVGPSTSQTVPLPSLLDVYSLMQQIQKDLNNRCDAFSLELQQLNKR